MHLAVQEAFRARWTEQIHEEWIRNVLKNRPDLSRERLERTKALMNAHAENSLVAGFEFLIETLQLPDLDDRHVLAAAIHAKADVIVTCNLKHFPRASLGRFGIRPLHPDEFVLELLRSATDEVLDAVCEQRDTLQNPAMTISELLNSLSSQGLEQSVVELCTRLEI
jgi:predicted nucleic acid-binding protein